MKKIKFPSFDDRLIGWDRCSRFYHCVNHKQHFVAFDTGEFIITQCKWLKRERGRWDDMGLQVAAVYDPGINGYKFEDPDGTSIPKAWIEGRQTLLLDLTQGKAYTIPSYLPSKYVKTSEREEAWWRRRVDMIPPRLERVAHVYYPAPDMPPVAGSVGVAYPDKLTPDEQKVANAAEIEIKTACALGAYGKTWIDQRKLAPISPRMLLPPDWRSALSNDEKVHIATYGTKNKKIFKTVPWLTFTPSDFTPSDFTHPEQP
jgi:hypothetical protein